MCTDIRVCYQYDCPNPRVTPKLYDPLCDWVFCGRQRFENNKWWFTHTPYPFYNHEGKSLRCFVPECGGILMNIESNSCLIHKQELIHKQVPAETLEQKVTRLDAELKQAKCALEEKKRQDAKEEHDRIGMNFMDVCPRGGSHKWIVQSWNTASDPYRLITGGYQCKCGAYANIRVR